MTVTSEASGTVTLAKTGFTRLLGYLGAEVPTQEDIAHAVVNARVDGIYEPAGPFVVIDGETVDTYYVGLQAFGPEFTSDAEEGNPAGVIVQVLYESETDVRVPLEISFGDADNRYYVSTLPSLASDPFAVPVTITMDGVAVPAWFITDGLFDGTPRWTLDAFTMAVSRETEW